MRNTTTQTTRIFTHFQHLDALAVSANTTRVTWFFVEFSSQRQASNKDGMHEWEEKRGCTEHAYGEDLSPLIAVVWLAKAHGKIML